MSERQASTQEYEWVLTLLEGFRRQFASRQDVTIYTNLPGAPTPRILQPMTIPGVLISFSEKNDSPKFPQVVFELIRQGENHVDTMLRHDTYYDWGVEEYYLLIASTARMMIFERDETELRVKRRITHFTSPRLGIQIRFEGTRFTLFKPDGSPFVWCGDPQNRSNH